MAQPLLQSPSFRVTSPSGNPHYSAYEQQYGWSADAVSPQSYLPQSPQFDIASLQRSFSYGSNEGDTNLHPSWNMTHYSGSLCYTPPAYTGFTPSTSPTMSRSGHSEAGNQGFRTSESFSIASSSDASTSHLRRIAIRVAPDEFSIEYPVSGESSQQAVSISLC